MHCRGRLSRRVCLSLFLGTMHDINLYTVSHRFQDTHPFLFAGSSFALTRTYTCTRQHAFSGVSMNSWRGSRSWRSSSRGTTSCCRWAGAWVRSCVLVWTCAHLWFSQLQGFHLSFFSARLLAEATYTDTHNLVASTRASKCQTCIHTQPLTLSHTPSHRDFSSTHLTLTLTYLQRRDTTTRTSSHTQTHVRPFPFPLFQSTIKNTQTRSDFNYENAPMWYANLDKLIHYANKDGRLHVFYSTPIEVRVYVLVCVFIHRYRGYVPACMCAWMHVYGCLHVWVSLSRYVPMHGWISKCWFVCPCG